MNEKRARDIVDCISQLIRAEIHAEATQAEGGIKVAQDRLVDHLVHEDPDRPWQDGPAEDGPSEPSVSYQRDASGGWDVGYLPLGGDLPWHYVGRFRDRESAKARAEEVAIILLGAMDLDHLENAEAAGVTIVEMGQ